MIVVRCLLVDDLITGPAAAYAGTRISATASASIGLTLAWSTSLGGGTALGNFTGSFVRDFYPIPSDAHAIYSVRMAGSQIPLQPVRRRFWDRSVSNEFQVATPLFYDPFYVQTKGKIRLLPPPAQTSDIMQIRYYRRMGMASASADASFNTSGFLDIPMDYESYLLAWSKWHFLTDKTQERSQQGEVWFGFAEKGLTTMMADQMRLPDENLSFIPGHYSYDPGRGENSTRQLPYEY